jgi:uncharacterized membrane protein
MHGIARLAIHATRIAPPGRNLKAPMADADSVEREVVEKFLQREPVGRDVHREEAEVETLGQRVADRVAQFGGSWTFIGLFAATRRRTTPST